MLPDVFYNAVASVAGDHLSIVPCFVSDFQCAICLLLSLSVYLRVCVALDDSLVCRSIDAGP